MANRYVSILFGSSTNKHFAYLFSQACAFISVFYRGISLNIDTK